MLMSLELFVTREVSEGWSIWTSGTAGGNYNVKRVDRKFNASDMLTHSASAKELRKFFPMIGSHTMTVKKENFNAVKTMLKGMPAAKVTAFLASMAETLFP